MLQLLIFMILPICSAGSWSWLHVAPVPELLTQLCPSASEACADTKEVQDGAEVVRITWVGSGRQAGAGTWWHIVAHSGIGEGHFQLKPASMAYRFL